VIAGGHGFSAIVIWAEVTSSVGAPSHTNTPDSARRQIAEVFRKVVCQGRLCFHGEEITH
jgi:hypothetical protein